VSAGPGTGHRRSRVWARKQVRHQVIQERAEGGAELERQMCLAQLARPKKRWQCEGSDRPCPFLSCRHHLAVEVTSGGGLKLNHPEADLEEMVDTCALDVADRGGITLEEVAERLNVTRERIRQEQVAAAEKFKHRMLNATGAGASARRATGA
jgi:hypothetical protein